MYGFRYGDAKKVTEIMRWVGHHAGVVQNSDVVTEVAAHDLRQIDWKHGTDGLRTICILPKTLTR